MPRQPRYFVPGLPQHVVVRGVDRQATFFAPDDYSLFLQALRRNADRYGCAVHAYVLMTNHVHLLLTPGAARSLPQLMQGMGREYVQAINRRYGRTGTLWQGRYKASLVQSDLYLLSCQRYIELNPVRAGMVTEPGRYRFSSYRYHAHGDPDPLIEPHRRYRSLGDTAHARQRCYRRLFEEELARPTIDTIRTTTNACQVLGSERFVDELEAMLKRRVRAGRPGRPRKAEG